MSAPVTEQLPTEIHGATVTAGPVPTSVEAPIMDRRRDELDWHICASRTQAACTLPNGGRFWVEDGRKVVVEAGAGDRPLPWLHASISALVLAQQGRFALHANVVDVAGMPIAICGKRRAGKSTTSLALAQRGHRLITDDVATLDVEGDAVVHRPAGRPVNVHPDTAARLGVSTEGGVPAFGDAGKLALSNPASPPVAVRAIVLLRAVEREGAEVQVAQLSTAERARVIHAHAYRRGLLDPIWRVDVFRWAVKVANRVPVWLLVRPVDVWTAEDVCEALEALPRVRRPLRSRDAERVA